MENRRGQGTPRSTDTYTQILNLAYLTQQGCRGLCPLTGFRGVPEKPFFSFLAASGGEKKREKWGDPTPPKGADRPFEPRFRGKPRNMCISVRPQQGRCAPCTLAFPNFCFKNSG